MEAILRHERKQAIDRVIEEITLTTGLSYPENNLLEIAKRLNIEVAFVNFGDESGEIRGFIKKGNKNEKSQILLNQAESLSDRTFTLAHELGHHFLHDGDQYFRDTYTVNLDSLEAEMQIEANYFAANFLMSKEKFQEVLTRTQDARIIADYFGVSESAVISRKIWLLQS